MCTTAKTHGGRRRKYMRIQCMSHVIKQKRHYNKGGTNGGHGLWFQSACEVNCGGPWPNYLTTPPTGHMGSWLPSLQNYHHFSKIPVFQTVVLLIDLYNHVMITFPL